MITVANTSIRLYQVKHQSGKVRLVQAANQAQALRHVATDEYTVSIPKPLEAISLTSNGVDVEIAGIHEENAS